MKEGLVDIEDYRARIPHLPLLTVELSVFLGWGGEGMGGRDMEKGQSTQPTTVAVFSV